MSGGLTLRSAADDRSGHLHRQAVGCLGASLPLGVYLFDRWRPTAQLDSAALDSISAYYYTSGVPLFAGILAALSVYLLTYRGYDNAWQQQDRAAAILAGLAAALVALFPTGHPVYALRPLWWTRSTGWVHYGAAAVLFGALIYIALVLFPKSKPGATHSLPPEKRRRNALYRLCGVAMILCMVWVAVAMHFEWSIFWAEALALEFFALSWLVKGRADQSLDHAQLVVRHHMVQIANSFLRMFQRWPG